MSSRTNARPMRLNKFVWTLSPIGLVFISLMTCFARTGVVSPRIANAEVIGAPRPVDFLFGFQHWLEVCQYSAAAAIIVLIGVCVVAWQRNPGHPYVLMAVASSAIVWQDPIMNWATYAVYNPQLWHLPEDWLLVRMSPTVEPFIVLAYTFFFFGPYFPAGSLLQRLQARQPMDAFVWRRPLLSLAALILVLGFVMDMLLEVAAVRTGTYIYSQAVPWASVFPGTTFQFPLLIQCVLITVVMIPAGVLCYRDDTGRAVAEKLSQRLPLSRTRPALATFLVMFGILNAAYFIYGAAFAMIRFSGIATALACPYPYPEAKVYDPQGYYQQAGQAGPFAEGYGRGWMTRQAEGRLKLRSIHDGKACLPGKSF